MFPLSQIQPGCCRGLGTLWRFTSRPGKLPAASIGKGPARGPRCLVPLGIFLLDGLRCSRERVAHSLVPPPMDFVQGKLFSSCPANSSFPVQPPGCIACPLELPSRLSPGKESKREALPGSVSPGMFPIGVKSQSREPGSLSVIRLCLGPRVTSGRLACLCLGIPIGKMLIIIVSISGGCWEH